MRSPIVSWRVRRIRKHRLDARFAPSRYVDLHEQILGERDQLHVHSDLTGSDAVLSVQVLEGKRHVVIVRNRIDLTPLLARLDDVISLIEGTLDQMYIEVKSLESDLPQRKI